MPMRCRGSLEVNDVFSDISASPLEMRFLGTTGSVHEGEGLGFRASCPFSRHPWPPDTLLMLVHLL